MCREKRERERDKPTDQDNFTRRNKLGGALLLAFVACFIIMDKGEHIIPISEAFVEEPQQQELEPFEDILLKNLRLDALNEAEQLMRYTLDVTDDVAQLAGGLFRHGVFSALADWTSSNMLEQLYRHGAHGPLVNLKLSFMGPTFVRGPLSVESRVISKGNTLASVRTRFIINERELACAKTTHYIAQVSSLKRPISEIEQ